MNDKAIAALEQPSQSVEEWIGSLIEQYGYTLCANEPCVYIEHIREHLATLPLHDPETEVVVPKEPDIEKVMDAIYSEYDWLDRCELTCKAIYKAMINQGDE